ncbi:ABC transporter substrate-binding protein [Bariatricus massiliensis]|uniref:ABC transporter substrate-binding protein n=1 Tax=Bariatricus massiliensis TaxID=1745713 RepID=A0ABS8DK99_9FIRM|nr:ABC transporter substrate-binding protein [Bariatricus massiliensis]MCB7305701.1 ABC transporter substrate-binding protein [Bariatricus massiliensis]MCB7376255.1 ABC transporter substrate-binding protein [Bariatricus massiliensis]MCB7388844.1 ABC transporter substrate-binding protein [Bariatricus massiliensis]MCB7413017.1 ABC transporter substrate-binding protein [Bariatricus massiliensis]MCQ5254422.1 ABC transporter substrate-binding protein [Bariatricus massiliensis]
MKRKRALLAAGLAAVCLLTACGQSSKTDSDSSEKKQEGISIALLDASNGNAWRAQMEAEMQEAAEQYKKDGIIKDYTVYSANDDATVQSSQLNQIVTAGKTDVVIINPVSATSLNPAIDKATQAGIKVIGVDSVIAHKEVVTIATDQYKWAEIQAEFLAEKLGGKGDIIIFNAMAGVPASDTREKAFDDVIAKYPDINVLKKVYHGWDEGEAKQLTTTMISTYPNIDGILNQDCSPGIMQGFQESGKDMPKVLTSDGSITYLNMWNDYNLDNPDKAFESIIVANPPGMGVDAIKIAIKLVQGGEFKEDVLTEADGGKAILLEPDPVITNENREEWVEKTKALDESYTFSSVLTDEKIDAMFK